MLSYPPTIAHREGRSDFFASQQLSARVVLDDRTQRTFNDFNRANAAAGSGEATILKVKVNNPYASVIPADIPSELELRSQRQALRLQQSQHNQQQQQQHQAYHQHSPFPQQQQQSFQSAMPTSPHAMQPPRQAVPFAGFLSEREEVPYASPVYQHQPSPYPTFHQDPSTRTHSPYTQHHHHHHAAPAAMAPHVLADVSNTSSNSDTAISTPSHLKKHYANGRPIVTFAPPQRRPPAAAEAPAVVAPPPPPAPAAAPSARAAKPAAHHNMRHSPAAAAAAPAPAAAVPSSPTAEQQTLEAQQRSVVVSVTRRHGATEQCVVAAVADVFPGVCDAQQLVGRHVIVEGDRGKDIAVVSAVRSAADGLPIPVPSGHHHHRNGGAAHVACGNVFGFASEQQIQLCRDLMQEEQHAVSYCQSQIHKVLPEEEGFVIERAVFQLDREKLTFFYRVPNRTYFVPLLKVLNQHYRCRIWMERVADEAKPAPAA